MVVVQPRPGELVRPGSLPARAEPLLELYQTEWCPSSHRVRERLTELGLDFVARQVPVERERRGGLLRVTGADTIPALVLDDGTTLVGEDAIMAFLGRRFEEPPEATTHRLKAARARRRYLEEECTCLDAPTR